MESMSAAASEALGRRVTLEPTRGGGSAGGGGASTAAVVDTRSGDKYFVKATCITELDILKAEYFGG